MAKPNTLQKPAAPKHPTIAQNHEPMVLVQDKVPEYLQKTPGRGSENVGTDDLVIPRLEIVQALSPAAKRGDPGYVDGAQAGMLTNSVSRVLYGDHVVVVPVYYMKQYLVWRDRKQAPGESDREYASRPTTGFFGAFYTMGEASERVEQEGGAAAHIVIIDTPQHLCLLLSGTGDTEEIMVSMPRTKAKVSRQWNSMVRMVGGDRFSRVYKVGTGLQKNAKGDFYNFDIKPMGFPSHGLYKQAEELYNKVSSGAHRVVMDVSNMEPSGGVDTEM